MNNIEIYIIDNTPHILYDILILIFLGIGIIFCITFFFIFISYVYNVLYLWWYNIGFAHYL